MNRIRKQKSWHWLADIEVPYSTIDHNHNLTTQTLPSCTVHSTAHSTVNNKTQKANLNSYTASPKYTRKTTIPHKMAQLKRHRTEKIGQTQSKCESDRQKKERANWLSDIADKKKERNPAKKRAETYTNEIPKCKEAAQIWPSLTENVVT